jgi:hypothetical protein
MRVFLPQHKSSFHFDWDRIFMKVRRFEGKIIKSAPRL